MFVGFIFPPKVTRIRVERIDPASTIADKHCRPSGCRYHYRCSLDLADGVVFPKNTSGFCVKCINSMPWTADEQTVTDDSWLRPYRCCTGKSQCPTQLDIGEFSLVYLCMVNGLLARIVQIWTPALPKWAFPSIAFKCGGVVAKHEGFRQLP